MTVFYRYYYDDGMQWYGNHHAIGISNQMNNFDAIEIHEIFIFKMSKHDKIFIHFYTFFGITRIRNSYSAQNLTGGEGGTLENSGCSGRVGDMRSVSSKNWLLAPGLVLVTIAGSSGPTPLPS